MLAVKGTALRASAPRQMVAAKMAALRTESPEAVPARLKTAGRTNAFRGVLAAVFVRKTHAHLVWFPNFAVNQRSDYSLLALRAGRYRGCRSPNRAVSALLGAEGGAQARSKYPPNLARRYRQAIHYGKTGDEFLRGRRPREP